MYRHTNSSFIETSGNPIRHIHICRPLDGIGRRCVTLKFRSRNYNWDITRSPPAAPSRTVAQSIHRSDIEPGSIVPFTKNSVPSREKVRWYCQTFVCGSGSKRLPWGGGSYPFTDAKRELTVRDRTLRNWPLERDHTPGTERYGTLRNWPLGTRPYPPKPDPDRGRTLEQARVTVSGQRVRTHELLPGRFHTPE